MSCKTPTLHCTAPDQFTDAQFTPPTRQDKTVLHVSCLLCRFELDDCSERVQTSDFLSATVFGCRESDLHRRRGLETDKTVLSCLAYRAV